MTHQDHSLRIRFRVAWHIGMLAALGLGAALWPPANRPAHADSQVGSAKRAVEQRLLDDAAKNIEKYRKGNLTIRVLTSAGKPMEGAKISVHQTRHEFLFGCIARHIEVVPAHVEEKRNQDMVISNGQIA